MKKILALTLALCLLLCGCGGNKPAETQAPATDPAAEVQPTAAPTEAAPETEAATEPAPEVYTHPLTGEILEAPLENRIIAVTICNLEDAIPHRGVTDADMYFEMFVNHSIIRGFALYTDIADVETIGSIRSTRPVFTDLAGLYDAFVAHAGGSTQSLVDQANSGIDNMNVDTESETAYSFRDKERAKKLPWENCLFAKGEGLLQTIQDKGFRTTQDPEKSYGLNFTQDGTPANGEDASDITIRFHYKGSFKETLMVYDQFMGAYHYNQYGQAMYDADTQAPEVFENVIVIFAGDKLDEIGYHIYDFLSGGDGYFACGGKITPIKWSCAGMDQPLTFTTLDGEPLQLGVGSTYVGLADLNSQVNWQ